MKKLVFLFLPFLANAQVARTVLVEHFTNSRCGACAGQNPSFYVNLANNPQVRHISYHPSSPFSNCFLSQHNQSENDARTNYYNLYGSTPRLAIQGANVSNNPNPFSNANLYVNYAGQTSQFLVKTLQRKTMDSIFVKVVVNTVSAHSFTNLRLYAAAAEDTVFYNAPNGENIHHDVFRRSFFGPNGIVINPAANVGDSVVFEGKLAKNAAWNFNRIFAYAILQNSTTRAMVQSDVAKPSDVTIITTSSSIERNENLVQVYPNPSANGKFKIALPTSKNIESEIEVRSIDGRLIQSLKSKATSIEIDLKAQKAGIYLLRISTGSQVMMKKLVKEI